jgi:hypothetical protein
MSITFGNGITLGAGVAAFEPTTLKLSLDAGSYTNITTNSGAAYGSGSTTGFFRVLNRSTTWDDLYATWSDGNWSCVQFPGSVVTNVTIPNPSEPDSPAITITGGTFVDTTFYSFTSGSIWADSVNQLPFRLYNGVTYDSDNGGSMVFVSTSSQYAASTTSLSNLSTWTVEAWHYYDGTNTGALPCIVTETFVGGVLNYTLGWPTGSPNLQAGFFNGNWQATPTGYTLASGSWYHLVGTYNGSAIRLYVNNTLINQTSYAYTPTSGGAGIRLMARWDSDDYWGGKLGLINIYEGAMTRAEIAKKWNANKTRFGLDGIVLSVADFTGATDTAVPLNYGLKQWNCYGGPYSWVYMPNLTPATLNKLINSLGDPQTSPGTSYSLWGIYEATWTNADPVELVNSYVGILFVWDTLTSTYHLELHGYLDTAGTVNIGASTLTYPVILNNIGSLTIATNSDGGLGGWNPTALSIAYNSTVISTYPVGSKITFQNGDVRTIVQWDDYGPTYIDLFWDSPTTSSPLFPITLSI